MLKPKFLLFVIIGLLCYGLLSSSIYSVQPGINGLAGSTPVFKPRISIHEKMLSKGAQARNFTKKNNYDRSICFFVDMSLPSGQKRFFVYNLKNDTVQNAGLVTHGSCNQIWLEGRKYGNTIGCGCTSLGKYRVGNSYHGRFGLAFKLYGLEKANENAFARFVVLHSHNCVPENEVKDDICQSEGCPTVAPAFLVQLQTIIKTSGKPLLLWIYE